MLTKSFREREMHIPASEVLTIQQTRYTYKKEIDSDGIVHTQKVEKVDDDFLDVPFRDFSISTMMVTGEINYLKFIDPMSDNSLDTLDRINSESDELSAKIDYMESMAAVAESAKNNVESSKTE